MNSIDASAFKDLLRSACASLENASKEIDTLNVFPVPDGDTGTNMSMTFSNGYNEAIKCSSDSVSDVAKVFSRGLLMGARGNSGVITSQIFRGFFQAIEGKESIDVADISKAFENGARIAYKAVIKPVEGTILTVVREASWYANHDYETNPFDLEEYFNRLCKYSNESLQRTPEYIAVLKEVGVVDSGGTGLVKIFEGMRDYVLGNPVDFIEKRQDVQINPALLLENEEFGYCTEFIFKLNNNYLNNFEENILKKKLVDMGGESLVVVKDDDLVKVHVHTLKPGDALNIAQRYGEFVKLKIENMQLQHSTITADANNDSSSQKTIKEKKKFGLITVAAGEGLTKLFYDLGCDKVISGGQTMNPSTKDFVDEINNLDNCENIFIFPNNSNIILSAKQAKDLCINKNIYVIESKTIQAGISAVALFDFSKEADENEIELKYILDNVNAGSITYAIKDTTFEGVDVKEGDYIGILDKNIVSSNSDIYKTIHELLFEMFNIKNKELLTIITGEGSNEERTNEIVDFVNANSSLEINIIEGNQPVYSYLFSLE